MLVLQDCRVDLERRQVLREDHTEHLTTKEAQLLRVLAERAGQDVSREQLLRDVWGYAGRVPNTRATDYAMRRLRSKVEADPTQPVHLLTVHGEGYRFVPLTDSAPAPVPSTAAIWFMSSAMPCGRPSRMSISTTSRASSFEAASCAQVEPTKPAPTTVILRCGI